MELYKGLAGSPMTTLASNITGTDIEMTINNGTLLPDAPNICTIWEGENIETIRYGTKSGNVLSNITRGVEGKARAWPARTKIARFYTAHDQDAIIKNIEDTKDELDSQKEDYANLEGMVTNVIDGDITNVLNNQLVATDIANKLNAKEVEYAPRLTNVETHLADVATQFKSTEDNETATLGNELVDSTGWTSTGWTGDFDNGFEHTQGQTTALTRSIGATGTKLYEVSFRINSPTSKWNLTVSIGGSAPFEIYTGDSVVRDYTISMQSITDGDLEFIPASTFDGTVSNISVKEVILGYEATTEIKDSNDENNIEIRNNNATKENTFIGKQSGGINSSGYGNNSLGHNTLTKNVAGFWNTAIGLSALENNVGGSRNNAIGYRALAYNISGLRNNALGSWALPRNTTGNKNIAIGADSLFYATTGNSNIAIGFSSMYNHENGETNIAIGEWALSRNKGGESNVAIGLNAMYYNNVSDCVAIGKNAMYSNISGRENVAFGTGAMQRNNGEKNTNIGTYAGSGTVGASYNQNTIIGNRAGTSLTTGSYNMLLGSLSGSLLSTGNSNLLMGYKAGENLTTGTNNIILGTNVNASSEDVNNEINIGNTIFGHTGTKALTFKGDVTIEGSRVYMDSLPTNNPSEPGRLWNNNGALAIS